MSKRTSSLILFFLILILIFTVVLTAVACDPPSYTISVDIPGYSHWSREIKKEEDIMSFVDSLLNKSEMKGFDFNGVRDNHGNIYMDKEKNIIRKFEKKISYKVLLTPQILKVVVHMPDGYGDIVQQVYSGNNFADIDESIVPKKYEVKWYKFFESEMVEICKSPEDRSLSLGAVYPADYNLTEDNIIDIYAEFIERKFKVNFVINSEKSISVDNITYGDNIFDTQEYSQKKEEIDKAIDEELQDDEYFAGWIFSNSRERFTGEVNENITIKLIKRKSNTVIFNYYKGMDLIQHKVQCMPYRDYALDYLFTIPEDDIKPGLTFAGWYDNKMYSGYPKYMTSFNDSSEEQTKTTSYYAKYTKKEYELSFSKNFEAIKYKSGDTTQLPTLESTDVLKEFGGWLIDNEGDPVFNIPEDLYGNHKLYPCFIARRFNITFETNGGETLEDGKAPYGENYTLAIPYKEGYRFLGWYDSILQDANQLTNEKGESLLPYSEEKDNIYYAKWEKYPYYLYISYVGEEQTVKFYFDEGDILNLNKITREGYLLKGMFLDSNCNTPFTQEIVLGESYNNKTFYTKWEEITYINDANDWLLLYSGEKTNYYLTKDINFGGEVLNAIPEFNGKLYGNGHKLTNYKINYSNKEIYKIGLITRNNGTILDLILDNYQTYIEHNDNVDVIRFIGNLVGVNYGTIENCKVTNGILKVNFNVGNNYSQEISSDSLTVGGIIGASSGDNAIISNCYHNGLIDVSIKQHRQGRYFELRHRIGGIAGESYRGKTINCINAGKINVITDVEGLDEESRCSNKLILGGISGWNNSNITQCISKGEIIVTNKEVNAIIDIVAGGVTGWNNEAMYQCVSKEKISTNGEIGYASCQIGGLVGYAGKDSAWILNSYAKAVIDIRVPHRNGKLNTTNNVGGLIGLTENCDLRACYADSKITDIDPLNGADDYGGFIGCGEGYIRNCFAKADIMVKIGELNQHGGVGFFNGKKSDHREKCYYVEGSLLNIDGKIESREPVALPIKVNQINDPIFLSDVLGWDKEVWDYNTLTLIFEKELEGGNN